MKKFSFLSAFLALSVLSLLAAGPNPKQVSKQANWVAHLEFQDILTSEIGSFMMKEARKDPAFNQKMNGMMAVFGLNLEKMGSATAYGSGKKDEGVIITKGGINTKQLEGFASLNEEAVVKSKGDKKTYSFKKGAFSSLGPDSIIIASDAEMLNHGLDVIDGKSQSQKKMAVASYLNNLIEKPMAIMSVHVPKVLEIQGESIPAPQAAVLKKADLVGFALGEAGTSMRMAMAMRASDEKTAEHLENVLRGAWSLLSLGVEITSETDSKEIGMDIDPEYLKLLQKAKGTISREKRNVGLTIDLETALLLEKITEEIQKRNSKKQKNESD